MPSHDRLFNAMKKAGAKIEDLTSPTYRDRDTGEEKDNSNTLHRHFIATKGDIHIDWYTQGGYPDDTKMVTSIIFQAHPDTDIMTDYNADTFYRTIKQAVAALG